MHDARPSATELPDSLLSDIATTIERYQLFDRQDTIIVALSGGKDSILLGLALKALGYRFVPHIVDMGYEHRWAERVSDSARRAGLEPIVIQARSEPSRAAAPIVLQIQHKLEILNKMGSRPAEQYTPCTHCYSAKALSLSLACAAYRSAIVAFGHHATDSAASLVKEALMHIDRHDIGNEHFVRINFERLVEQLSREASEYTANQPAGPLMKRIAELVKGASIDTDEPPRQWLLGREHSPQIVRPLFDVREYIIQRIASQINIQPEPSGCGHGATKYSQTPRQMVHHRIFGQGCTNDFHEFMSDLARYSVSREGWGVVNARHRRRDFLGPEYKPTIDGLDKYEL